jgi:hypothetical protein
MTGIDGGLHSFTLALLKKLRMGVLWFHVPNGAKMSPITKKIMKSMGARAGVADFLIVVGGRANFLEVKKPGGNPSPDQLKFKADCELAGARYMVADNENEVTEYLKAIGAM